MQLTMNSKLSLTLGMVSGAVLGKLAWDSREKLYEFYYGRIIIHKLKAYQKTMDVDKLPFHPATAMAHYLKASINASKETLVSLDLLESINEVGLKYIESVRCRYDTAWQMSLHRRLVKRQKEIEEENRRIEEEERRNRKQLDLFDDVSDV
ncbi:hypothetical protein fnug_129 [Pseudomonas phage fnug]|nr:hypothetical protein fnug_129 [Pseudomonas phage fnug]QOV07984.1 hypothetical protein [Pseudomonas phage vB_PaeM_kmuB]UXD83113.1 hypothetical protein NP274_00061 [Pseudomonas phage Koomba boorn-mokiny kep-wari Wadjak 1]UXD83561.1 hypothetical protein NP274_00154 [Pseudomonas phage Koomba boorn-mokiny kep-wari Wadjak 2]